MCKGCRIFRASLGSKFLVVPWGAFHVPMFLKPWLWLKILEKLREWNQYSCCCFKEQKWWGGPVEWHCGWARRKQSPSTCAAFEGFLPKYKGESIDIKAFCTPTSPLEVQDNVIYSILGTDSIGTVSNLLFLSGAFKLNPNTGWITKKTEIEGLNLNQWELKLQPINY